MAPYFSLALEGRLSSLLDGVFWRGKAGAVLSMITWEKMEADILWPLPILLPRQEEKRLVDSRPPSEEKKGRDPSPQVRLLAPCHRTFLS